MKKYSLLFLLLVVFSVVLCGCGDGTKNENGGKGSEASGRTVVVGITNDMDSLDPHKAVAAGTSEVLYNVFEGLVKADQDGVMRPALCTDYEISADALTYTFTLRDGVKFHNGKALEAKDVIYSLNRVAGKLGENDIKLISAFSVISDITEKTGDDGKKQVVVSLSEPNTELINYFDAAVIPEDYKDQVNNPVGTGPFKFVSYSPMESIVLSRYEDYYGEKPQVAGVTFSIYASVDDAFMELMAGKIDIFPYLALDQTKQLEDKFNIEVGQQSLAEGLYLNNAYEPLSDVRVRQALSYAVDYKAIDEVCTGGVSHVLKSGMFPSFKEYYNADTEKYYPHDVAKAKELLKEAGYENLELEITIPNNYQLHISIAEMLVDQLAEAGVKATIKKVDWSTWLSEVYVGRNYQATVIALDATMAPADVLRYFVKDHHSNFVNYDNAEFNELYQKALGAVDQSEKVKYYKLCQENLAENAASVWLMSPSIMVAVNKELTGYTFYPIYVQDISKIKVAE